MHEQEQRWTLICLRSMEGRPSGEDLHDRFGMKVCRVLSDVHPADAEQAAGSLGDGLLLTVSKTIIDLFVPASVEDARKRLWFADAEGQLRQLDHGQAVEFWLAWRAGVQHVSEILVSRGLW